jgi:hypothetical protein
MLAKSIWPFEALALLLLLAFLRSIWTVPVRYVRWRLGGAGDVPVLAASARSSRRPDAAPGPDVVVGREGVQCGSVLAQHGQQVAPAGRQLEGAG